MELTNFNCIICVAISRKQYVKEKLFNQMFNELYDQQLVKSHPIELNTEYSDKFSAKHRNAIQQQVRMRHSITFNKYSTLYHILAIQFYIFNSEERVEKPFQSAW